MLYHTNCSGSCMLLHADSAQAVHKELKRVRPELLQALDDGDSQAISAAMKQLNGMYTNMQVC